MDFLTMRTVEIGSRALDGLSSRQKAISANIANANTEGYQRTDVEFESQLASIINQDDALNQTRYSYMKANTAAAGMSYNVPSLDQLTMQGADVDFSKINVYKDFQPEIVSDTGSALSPDGNNVNIETEMAELAKNGTKYQVISELLSRKFSGIETEIKSL